MQFMTPQELKGHLRLCLTPGPDRPGRTLTQLVQVMPNWVTDHFTVHAPHLALLHDELMRAELAAAESRARYAEHLRAWIAQDAELSGTAAQPAAQPCPQSSAAL